MDFKSPTKCYLIFVLLLIFNSACSVSSSGQELANLTSPPADSLSPEPDSQSPVLVTSPVELIPEPETLVPEVVSNPEELTPVVAPVEQPNQPSLVDIVQPNPELPPLVVIEETPITTTENTQPENTEPQASVPEPQPESPTNEAPTSEQNPEISNNPSPNLNSTIEVPEVAGADSNANEVLPVLAEYESAPPALVEAIEQIDFNDDDDDSSNDSDNDKGQADHQSENSNPENEEMTEIKVEGSCFGKSNAALIFTNKKSKRKKSKSKLVICENGYYKIKLKGKKKNLRDLKVQAAFY